MVIHNEDHAYSKTLLFCEKGYAEMVRGTFLSRGNKIFQRIGVSMEEATTFVRESLPEELKQCKWAFGKESK